MEVSIAYQGGGARVLELMAAAQACRLLEQSKKIKVVRASGSSAGAIAAAMLVTKCDIEKIAKGLPTYKDRVEKAFPQSRLNIALIAARLLMRLPIYN